MVEQQRFPDFDSRFLSMALFFGLAGGFGLAGYLGLVIGFGLVPSSHFQEIVQLHGHLQLVGFIGLVLLGVSLYVLPRLLGRPLGISRGASFVLSLMVLGLLLRVVGQGFGPQPNVPGFPLVLLLGCVLETFGITLYLITVLRHGYQRLLNHKDGVEILNIWPFFILMFLGWAIFGILQLIMGWKAFVTSQSLLSPPLSFFAEELFLFFTLIPAIAAFGVRMLPIFLGLREPRWPVERIALWYMAGAIPLVVSLAMALFNCCAWVAGLLFLVGSLVMTFALFWYLFELDPLALRKVPERVVLKQFRSDATTIRGRYGDRGEFGHFEWCIYPAYGWLLLGTVLLSVHAFQSFLTQQTPSLPSPLMHLFMVGFVINMVLGVGLRLLPKLVGNSAIKPPWLSAAVAILINIAVVLRVGPPILGIGFSGFGLSGVLGLASIILFAVALRFCKIAT